VAHTDRPRRSVLYMPGSNARALAKGRTLPADGLILDLEDACAPDKKDEARAMIATALAEGGYGRRELLIRINGLDTSWGEDDIRDLADAGAHGLLLPKVESAATVTKAEKMMAAAGAPENMAIWCMIETPLGVLRAEEIAKSSRSIGGFVMGTSDLAKDLRAQHTPDRVPFLTSLGLCVLVARAYGLAVLDGVYLDLEDDEGFAAACRQGMELGFDGKTLIHPKTIATANHVFGPSDLDVEESRAVIAAFETAQAAGQAVVVLNGRLVENLHVENARRILRLAEMVAEMEADVGAPQK